MVNNYLSDKNGQITATSGTQNCSYSVFLNLYALKPASTLISLRRMAWYRNVSLSPVWT